MSNVINFAPANDIAARAADMAGKTLKSVADSRTDLFRVNPYMVKVKDGQNTREMSSPATLEHIKQLAQSIVSEGVRVPVRVWKDGDAYYLTDGHCRHAAVIYAIERLGATGPAVESIPVMVETRGANETDRLMDQMTMNTGKEFTTFEQGKLFARLMRLGVTKSEISERSARSIAHIDQCLLVQEAPAEIRNAVVNNEISHTLAVQTIREYGSQAPELIGIAIKQAKSQGKAGAKSKDVQAVLDTRKAAGSTVDRRAKEKVTRQGIAKYMSDHANEILDVEHEGVEGRFIPEHVFLELRKLVGF